MKRKTPLWLAVCGAAAVALMLGAAGCQSYDDHRGKGDAPALKGDDSPAFITNMPDGFPNAAIKCMKGDAPWAQVASTSGAWLIIQDPARCGGKVIVGDPAAVGN